MESLVHIAEEWLGGGERGKDTRSYTILTAPPQSSIHSVRMRGCSIPRPPTKRCCQGQEARMVVRLCAYYEFYDKKVRNSRRVRPLFISSYPHPSLHPYPSSHPSSPQVTSQLLCNAMGSQLATYLREEGYICLIQCFLNPQLMLCHPESPNPLSEDTPVLELVPGVAIGHCSCQLISSRWVSTLSAVNKSSTVKFLSLLLPTP